MPFGCSKDVASSGSIIFLILYAFTILMLRCAEAGCDEKTYCYHDGVCGYGPGDNETSICLCTPQYCGPRCQFVSPCVNGGSCAIHADSTGVTLSCDCPVNFTGRLCEHYHACSSDPCPGNRRCEIDDLNHYRCLCLDEGYHGSKCDVYNVCHESPCLNGGDCIFAGHNRSVCECSPNSTGYYGVRCEQFDFCLTSPCNAGTCLQDPNGGLNVTCVCDGLHYGNFCQYEDQCVSSPCYNEGQCSTLETGGYSCDCPPGYHGNRCFLSVCSFTFCRNDGTCFVNKDGDPLCWCTNEYYGAVCESLNPCLKSDLCQNGGNCTDVSGASFSCDCAVGWNGFLCRQVDRCVSSPCQENQTCVSTMGSYTCNCRTVGYYGAHCTEYDACTDTPCLNGGRCISGRDTEYTCDCTPHDYPTGYHGTNCELFEPCSEHLHGVCSYHGDCEFKDSEPGYECTQCDEGFYGTRCERYDSCHSKPCLNGGQCIPIYLFQDHWCNCSLQYTGKNCEKTVTCNNGHPSVTVSTKGAYVWPDVLIKETGSLPCEVGDGFATRQCEAVISSGNVLGTYWLSPDTSACHMVNLTTEVAKNFTYYLLHTTSNAEDMYQEELTSSTDLLLAIIIYAYVDLNFANDVMVCMSNILEVNETIIRDSSVESETNTKLLSVIDSFAENTVLSTNDSKAELITDNIEITINDVPMDQALTTGSDFQSSLPNSSGVFMKIPAEAFLESRTTGDEIDSVRVNYVILSNTKLFIPTDGESSEVSYGYAVSANIIGKTVTGLKEPVTISLPVDNDAFGRHPKCAFWNEEDQRWDTTGMQLISTENNSVVCQSSHLTYFAIIMDPGLSAKISPFHRRNMTIISKVGVSITLIGLLLTFITYVLFKQLRVTRSGKILIHLCASLFCLNLVFFIDSIPSMTSSYIICMGCAILLHYFVLTSFAWMGMEAVNMYRALVQVFVRGSTGCFMTKCILLSWGAPIFVVTITAAADLTHYGRERDFCLVLKTNPYVYYITYLGPCCLILAANIVVFAMVIHAVSSCNSKRLRSGSATTMPKGVRKTQIGCALSVTFLLGLTWVFGLFAVGEATLAFQYIFTILNTMQGFFIFLFRCALYPEALRCWRSLIVHHTLNPRRTPGNTAMKNNTNSHSQKGTSKCALSSHPQPMVPIMNIAYVPDDVGRKGTQLPTSKSNKYAMNSYEKEITLWGKAMNVRNVTLNNIKPRNCNEGL
ncbi:uncharacterized protein [Asterias amurensis]|uniref:uncharacterized protein n=1 Tax=Asterias amurensis TaxID=7602 RepID=UPI003AB3B94F